MIVTFFIGDFYGFIRLLCSRVNGKHLYSDQKKKNIFWENMKLGIQFFKDVNISLLLVRTVINATNGAKMDSFFTYREIVLDLII